VSQHAPSSGDAADVEVENTPDYQQRVATRAEQLHHELSKQEKKKAPAERLGDQRLWTLARQKARSEVRRAMAREKTREVSGRAARSAANAARSGAHRNRKQLLPWALVLPYGLVGTLAHLASQQGSVPVAGGVVLVLLLGVVGSLVAWRVRLRDRTPARYRAKLHAGMGLGTVWAAVMPVTSSSALAGPWLGLLIATVWLSLSWFREHDHPIPQPGSGEDSTDAEVPAATGLSDQIARVRGIITAWTDKVAAGARAPIPGSTLVHLSSNGIVDCYRITLDDTGPVSGEQITQHVKDVAFRLGVLSDRISFEVTTDPRVVMLRHQVGEPSYDYTGPVVLCDGKPIHSRWEITPGSTVDIVYGYYLDGQGQTTYRIIESGSVNSLFILGSTGSGKTVLFEVVAVALRFLGAWLLYIDGQGGASSQALTDHADRVYEPDADGVEALAADVSAICADRSHQLKTDRSLRNRYTYAPHRPPIIIMMEEAHRVWCLAHPRGGKYGEVFGVYGSEIRKLGVGYVAASQDFDQAGTFGGSGRLRDAFMAGGNFAAMRMTNKSRIGMLPTECPSLDTVPKHGYGFSPFAERPAALWRVPALVYEPGKSEPDTAAGQQWPEEWMQQYQPDNLPELAAAFPLSNGGGGSGAAAETTGGSTHSGNSAGVVRFPGMGNDNTESSPAEPDATALSESDQGALAIIQGEPQTRSTLAAALAITPQGAGKKLATLTRKGFVVRMEDGRYMAR